MDGNNHKNYQDKSKRKMFPKYFIPPLRFYCHINIFVILFIFLFLFLFLTLATHLYFYLCLFVWLLICLLVFLYLLFSLPIIIIFYSLSLSLLFSLSLLQIYLWCFSHLGAAWQFQVEWVHHTAPCYAFASVEIKYKINCVRWGKWVIGGMSNRRNE